MKYYQLESEIYTQYFNKPVVSEVEIKEFIDKFLNYDTDELLSHLEIGDSIPLFLGRITRVIPIQENS